MSISLAEALEQVNLTPGTYHCEVKGRDVVVQVLDRKTVQAKWISSEQFLLSQVHPITIDESDIMLDPWVELPGPSGGIILEAHPGEPELPDVPEIPPYDETEENL